MKEENIGITDDYIDSIIISDNTKVIFDKVMLGISKPGLFFNPNGMHGKGHTARVMKLLSVISCLEKLNDNEKKILAYTGLYHDIGRTNDYYDLIHGRTSYEKLVSTGLISNIKLNKQDIKTLKYIIENHCIPDDQGKENVINYGIKDLGKALKLYYIFKDADCLDRVRLGDLDEKFVRLKSSKSLIPIAKYLFFESDIDLI